MSKIRKDDEVLVLTGRDRSRRGRVLKVMSDGRALVEGIHMVKKHVKRQPQRQESGGIVTREAPIHLSNLALIDPSTNRPGRVGFKHLEDGRKVRYFKSSGELVVKG